MQVNGSGRSSRHRLSANQPAETNPGIKQPPLPVDDRGIVEEKCVQNDQWHVYLSGEIHTDWRDQIAEGARVKGLPVVFTSAVTVHEDSDDCGVRILGEEPDGFWKDHKGAKLNAIRTRTLLEQADLVVVRFGDKYRQWNAAFDAGFAAALGKPVVTLRDDSLTHPMKEVDAAALAVATDPEQVVQILDYVIAGKLR